MCVNVKLLSTTMLTKFEELVMVHVKWCTLFYSPISIYLLCKYWCMYLLVNVENKLYGTQVGDINMAQGNH